MGKIKKALITGITGQDGSYLAEFLIKKKLYYSWFKRRRSLEDAKHLENKTFIKKIFLIMECIF